MTPDLSTTRRITLPERTITSGARERGITL